MIFKKHISVFLACFMLVSNLGLAFNVHYCDDEIASVSINPDVNSYEVEKDCCGEVEKDSKCCSNKIIKSSEKSDQIIAKSLSFDFDNFILVENYKPIGFVVISNIQKREAVTYYCNANAPPLYKLYCQFTLFG